MYPIKIESEIIQTPSEKTKTKRIVTLIYKDRLEETYMTLANVKNDITNNTDPMEYHVESVTLYNKDRVNSIGYRFSNAEDVETEVDHYFIYVELSHTEWKFCYENKSEMLHYYNIIKEWALSLNK